MAFQGFATEALTFYEGLEADNSKAYWTANRATFDDAVYYRNDLKNTCCIGKVCSPVGFRISGFTDGNQGNQLAVADVELRLAVLRPFHIGGAWKMHAPSSRENPANGSRPCARR